MPWRAPGQPPTPRRSHGCPRLSCPRHSRACRRPPPTSGRTYSLPRRSTPAMWNNESSMYVDLHDLFAEHSRVLAVGGRYVTITGCRNPRYGQPSKWVSQINAHVECNIHSRRESLRAMADNRLVPQAVIDLTPETLPYWELRATSSRVTGIEDAATPTRTGPSSTSSSQRTASDLLLTGRDRRRPRAHPWRRVRRRWAPGTRAAPRPGDHGGPAPPPGLRPRISPPDPARAASRAGCPRHRRGRPPGAGPCGRGRSPHG